MFRVNPPEHLKEVVEGFYVFKAEHEGERSLFFNDGYPVVALMQDSNENVRVIVDGQVQCVGNIWVCGGVLRNIYSTAEPHFGDCLVIRFYPLTFFKLFGVGEDCFQKKQVFDFAEIAGYGFGEFQKAYYHSSSRKESIDIIAGFLSGKMSAYAYPEVLTDIQNYMERQPGCTVKGILEHYSVRLNYKWLERNFKKHLGMSPQNYILVRRFLGAYLDLDALASKDLLQVAVDHGYCDDNHFIKDFRRFSGMPPKAYFKIRKGGLSK